MRRPLTVRWWFRVALIVIVLVGGYGTLYVLSRSVWVVPDGVHVVYEGDVKRYYATTEQGRYTPTPPPARSMAGMTREQIMADREASERALAELVRLMEEDGPRRPYGYAGAVNAGDGSWWASRYRLFGFAERVELWVRGIDPLDGKLYVHTR